MNLQQVFEHLQEHKICKMQLPDVRAAESLRIMLVKKWSQYKNNLGDLGFLDDKTRNLSMSMQPGKIAEDNESQEFTFQLKARSRSQMEYTILSTNLDKDAS